MKHLLLLLLIVAVTKSNAQNLVSNPGFEQPVSNGWTIVDGNWGQTDAGYGYGDPNNGDYYTTPGFISGTKEMYQDVDVSASASAIDNGTASFSASAYLQVASNGDTAKTIIEYRNSFGDVLVSDIMFEKQSAFNVWKLKTAGRIAPAGTRTVRIRLLAIPNSGFGDLVMFDDISLTKTTVLPLTLLYFKAVAQNDKTIVTWQTANEINVSSFELQSGADATQFNTVKRVNAGRNDNTYIETLPLNNGATYYRLKTTDRNGEHSYSQVVKVEASNKSLVTVYPNPANDRLIISVGQTEKRSVVNIYNSNGRLVSSGEMLDAQVKTIDVAALPTGIYQIHVVSPAQKITQTLVITH